APRGRFGPPTAHAPAASSVTSAGMLATVQCQKPDPVGASGSKQVTAKLLVPSGAPDHDSWGEVFPKALTWASGRTPPSAKSADVTVKLMAALSLGGFHNPSPTERWS